MTRLLALLGLFFLLAASWSEEQHDTFIWTIVGGCLGGVGVVGMICEDILEQRAVKHKLVSDGKPAISVGYRMVRWCVEERRRLPDGVTCCSEDDHHIINQAPPDDEYTHYSNGVWRNSEGQWDPGRYH